LLGSGFYSKAVGYWHKAGQQAMARGAMTEAVSLLSKGLELLRGMPDDVGRQEQELDLQIVLGNALIATNG
jgi:predicted ATPase